MKCAGPAVQGMLGVAAAGHDDGGRGTVGGIPAEVVPLAVATAVSPLPLVVLLVVLLTPRAVPNGVAFTCGWASALLLVGAATAALVGAGAGLDERGSVVSSLEVLVGLLLLLLAVRQWSRRPRGGSEATVPRWLLVADRSTPRRAYAMGAVLVVANPKNLALTVAAAGTIADADAGAGGQLSALLIFAALGSVGLAVPLALRITLGVRAAGLLSSWRLWLVRHGTPIACAVLALIGCLLLVRGRAG
jgi:threonine/homoserine/homoserine lactone efflux protein